MVLKYSRLSASAFDVILGLSYTSDTGFFENNRKVRFPMHEETGAGLLLFYAFALPALVGGLWMSNWLYFRKENTRHWAYIVTLLALMGLQAFFFREGPFRSTFFAMALAIPGAIVGGILGGVFGQFFLENQGGTENTPDSGAPKAP